MIDIFYKVLSLILNLIIYILLILSIPYRAITNKDIIYINSQQWNNIYNHLKLLI